MSAMPARNRSARPAARRSSAAKAPTRALAAALACLCFAAGCTQNPYVLQGQVQSLEQQRLALDQRFRELESRTTSLDKDNQELSTLLAQSQQQNRILSDQLGAVQQQLRGTTEQLAQLRTQYQSTEQRAESLLASAQRRTAASIQPNSSLRQRLPDLRIAGVEVRQDGDVVRVEMPSTRLFEPAGARLLPGADRLVMEVAAELARLYPQQIIGIEGHLDSDPLPPGPWVSHHQLSVGRAMAIYDELVRTGRFAPPQLFVVGHGSNHPVVSNGTPAGRERNRRVEIVVYPEQAGGR